MYEYKAKVVDVLDGDTVKLDIDLGFSMVVKGEIVRLYGVNTMEKTSKIAEEKALALKAKARVEELCPIGSDIVLQTFKDKKEKYGRYLGTLITKDYRVVNEMLVEEGLAVKYFGEKR